MEEFEKQEAIEQIFEGFTERERTFVEHYCRYMSKAGAARACGLSEKNAKECGFHYYHRPKIKDAIKKYLALLAVAPEENIARISKISKTNLTDYFRPVSTYQLVRVKVPLLQIIIETKTDIDVEDDYLMECSGSLSNLEKTASMQTIKDLNKKLSKLKIRISRDPKAFEVRFVDKLVTEKVLNIDALVEDQVPLKSIKYTKEGVQVETYPADAAQERLAKINGSFEADNKQLRPVINNAIGLTAEKLAKLTDEELRIMSAIEKKLNA